MRFALCVLMLGLTSPVHSADPAASQTIRVACVGDSITYGSGIENREKNSYPAVLGRLLGEKYDVRNFGVSGATLQKKGDKPYWTLDEFKDVAAFNPQIVIVKLGTNDTKPQNWHGVDVFKIDLMALVKHLQSLPAEPRVFLCTPVPVHRDAFGIREAVVRNEVVPAINDIAEATQLPVIDLYKALQGAADDFPDGVHPNAAGAKTIAESVAKSIPKQVGPTRPVAEPVDR